MTSSALSEQQSQTLSRIVAKLATDCEADAVAVCDAGGNILAQDTRARTTNIETAAALAAASLAATRELAATIGETGFRSIFHRGHKAGILIQALGAGFLVLVILSKGSVEGLVRLHLKKIGRQLESVLCQTEGQTLESAGAGPFEVEEVPDTETKKD